MNELFLKLLPYGISASLFWAAWALVPSGSLIQQVSLQRKKFITANELEFFRRLRKALPDFEILPQVSMGALLDTGLPDGHRSSWAIRRLYAMKIVDFVVCDPRTLNVLLVIELDDQTHVSKRDKDAKRDNLLASVGIPTVRWESKHKPTTAEISRKVQSIVSRQVHK